MRQNKIRNIILIGCVLVINIALAQQEQSNVSFITDEAPKHQIGIGISRFVNVIFPSDSNAFLVEYRYVKNKKNSYRLAGDYRLETAEDALYDFALKIGFDRTFKQKSKWIFYYGIDFWVRNLYYQKRKQNHTNIAVNPFLGISYQFNKYFSISTEPGFFIKYNISKDNKTFDEKSNPKWWESRFAKVGYLQLNFHF